MRRVLLVIGFGLIVLTSGAVGSLIGMNLGPLELGAHEVSIGCAVLGVTLAVLTWRGVSYRCQAEARKHALMRIVERRMSQLSQTASRLR